MEMLWVVYVVEEEAGESYVGKVATRLLLRVPLGCVL